MQTTKTKVMFVIALLLAVAAAWLANMWVQQRVAQNGSGGGDVAQVDSAQVVVASSDISYGQEVEMVHLKIAQWPKHLVPEGAISDPSQVEGKVANQNILAGDIITDKRVVAHLAGSRLASLVGKHKRAVSVRVDDVVGVSGFILPGNRVDVLGVKKNLQTRKVKVDTVLEDIKVLAVDQDVSPDKDKPKLVRSVTLELSKGQTEDLVVAMNEGKIQLALRNPLDRVVEKPKPVAKPKPKPVKVVKKKKKAAPVSKVTVIRGTDIEKAKPRI